MATENKDWGYLWEGEAEGVSSLENIWFRYADNLDAVDAAAFGIDSEGNVSRDTTVISAGNLLYDPLTKYFSCKCPFEKVERWKLYIWRRNEDLSLRELEWSNGQKIPVSGLVSDVNTLKQRVKDHTTNIGRSLKVPEIGTSSLLFPPKEVRAGQVAGFDDDGNPATGENVAQVKELYDVQRNCEDYVDKAAAYAKDSEQSAERSWQYAEESRESAYNAADSEDDALAHAKEAQGWYEKTGEAAETGIANIEQAAAKAEADFDGKIKDAVSTAEEAKDSAKEDADRAEDVYAKLIELKENYEKLECFICCAAKHVEKNRKFVEDLLAENAEGLNALSPATTSHQGIVYLAESADDKRESTVLSAAMSAEILSDVVADVSADLADLRAKLTSAMHYKGAVATKAELPTTGNEPGDVWNVIEDGKNYAWDGTAWDDISGVMSIPQATTTTLGGVKLYSSTVGSTTGSAAVLLTATGCMVVPQATTTKAGVGKLGTVIVPADDGGMVGLTNNGSFAVGIASNTLTGCVRVGGDGIGISDKVLNITLRTDHSGLGFDNKALYVNCAEQTSHPAAADSASVATNTEGKLCVVKASTTTNGAVKLATSLDDAGAASVPTAEQVKTGLSTKAESSHTHTIDNITSLQTTLDEKAAVTTVSRVSDMVTALETAMGGKKIVVLTQASYDALTTKDANTLYFING